MRWITLLLLFPVVLASAQPPALSLETPELPAHEWTDRAKLLLAQALAGEAGWLPEYRELRGRLAPCRPGRLCVHNVDWDIIPYVLLRRWDEMRWSCERRGVPCASGGGPISFATTIQSYCSPLKPHLASDSYLARVRGRLRDAALRRRFLQAILWDGNNLPTLRAEYGEALGRHARGNLYADGWLAIRDTVGRFGAGQLPDACPRARHWDGPWSTPPQALRRVDCGHTLNVYSAPAWVVARWEAKDGRIE